MPPASVYDIKINPTTGLTAVFTYGRGAYAMLGATAATAPSNLSSTVTGSTVTLTWRPPSSGAPTTGAMVRTYSVRATVVNDCGVSVESNRMTFSQR